MTRLIAITVALLAALVTYILIAQSSPDKGANASDRDSLLHVPAVDYRRDWVLLGSPILRH